MMEQTKQSNSSHTPSPYAWGLRDIIAVILLVAVGMVLLLTGVRVVTALTGWQVGEGLTSPILYLVSIGIYGLLLVGVYQFAARQSGWKALGIQMPAWWTIGITPVLLVIEFVGMLFINQIIAHIRGGTFENPQIEALTGGHALGSWDIVLLLVLIAGVAPLAEELFFRGMIYPWIRSHWGVGGAIVMSAGIFAFFHFIPLLMPSLFFIGLILGLLREWSKSTIPCIVLHMLQNGVVVLGMSMLMG